jgi:hypothetical protein
VSCIRLISIAMGAVTPSVKALASLQKHASAWARFLTIFGNI